MPTTGSAPRAAWRVITLLWLPALLAGCAGLPREAASRNASSSAALKPFLRVWEADLATARDPVLSLTPAAEAQQRRWVPGRDDPLLRCIAPGMPSMISNPYPIRFDAETRGFSIHYEEFASVRHVLWQAPAREPKPTPQGTAVAHWDGNVLEVHTTRIAPGYFNRDGLAQSAQIDVVERYGVSADGNTLTLNMRVTDPQAFTRPVEFLRRWAAASPGTELLPYDCVPDTSFDATAARP